MYGNVCLSPLPITGDTDATADGESRPGTAGGFLRLVVGGSGGARRCFVFDEELEVEGLGRECADEVEETDKGESGTGVSVVVR